MCVCVKHLEKYGGNDNRFMQPAVILEVSRKRLVRVLIFSKRFIPFGVLGNPIEPQHNHCHQNKFLTIMARNTDRAETFFGNSPGL